MKVKLKSQKEFKKMVRNGEVDLLSVSDSGELRHYGTVYVAPEPSHILSIWFDDYGQEYLVVDHPNPISRENYEKRKVFFEETK